MIAATMLLELNAFMVMNALEVREWSSFIVHLLQTSVRHIQGRGVPPVDLVMLGLLFVLRLLGPWEGADTNRAEPSLPSSR